MNSNMKFKPIKPVPPQLAFWSLCFYAAVETPTKTGGVGIKDSRGYSSVVECLTSMFNPLYGWMAGRREGGEMRNKLGKVIKVGGRGRCRRERDHES